MTEITKDNIQELFEPYKEKFLHYHQIRESITKFENYANTKTFKLIFGEDGLRLMQYFKNDCNSDFDKFKSYLTQDQINSILMNLHINKNFIY